MSALSTRKDNHISFRLLTLTIILIILPWQIATQTADNLLPSLNINLPLPSLTHSTASPIATPPNISVSNRFGGTGVLTFTPLDPLLNNRQASVAAKNAIALRESFRRIAHGAQQFGLELLSKFSDVLHESNLRRDFMISPFAIWSLLLLLTEAAAGNTLVELRKVLHLNDDDQLALRKAYRDVANYLKVNTSTIEVASMQALFTDINQPVGREFENLIERDYGTSLIPVDFTDPVATTEYINKEVRELTRGFIPHTVVPQDLKYANLFMVSALYFKGQWKYPFNKTFTRTEPFYDEDGKPIGDVEMMVQEANFNYAGMNELESHVLELPYGKEDRLSMVVILPRKGVSLNKVVHNLQNLGIAPIFKRLAESAVGYEDEDVEVFLPRFNTSSDLSMTRILEDLGILDIFAPDAADLSKMSPNVYVSAIIHATKIVVNEEGTEAAAVASAVLANKATPPKFYLNRPFLYLILEKSTNVLLFVGQVTNPNNII